MATSDSDSAASASQPAPSSPPENKGPAVGQVLGGRWEVRERIGTGGMASVYRGVDHRLERSVAVKMLHPHIAENPDARERLAREARAIAQLRHENVIEVYDYNIEDPDHTWLISELVEGCSLRQFLERTERLMPEVAVMVVAEIVRALRAAHEMGVIHRDVKPDNVLIGKSGRPKLSDFGIAKVLNETRMTMTGNLVGSPSYMSPEQAEGLHTDHRTDLYSVGIVLYRLVTGTLPYRGSTPIETIRKVSLGQFVDPAELAPDCAGQVAGIIRRALTFDIEKRYQTADQMLTDLVMVLQDAGLGASSEELPKYFADPVEYQAALRPRLAKELESRGRALLDAGEEARAVDCFNRALSLGEGDQRTVDLVRELSRRRTSRGFRKAAWVVGTVALAITGVTGAILLTDFFSSGSKTPERPALAATSPAVPEQAKSTKAKEDVEPPQITAPEVTKVKGQTSAKAETPTKGGVEKKATKSKKTTRGKKSRRRRKSDQRGGNQTQKVKSAPSKTPEEPKKLIVAPKAMGTLHVGTRKWVDIYVDGKRLGRAPDRSRYPVGTGQHQLKAVKPGSDCEPFYKSFQIEKDRTTRLRIRLNCQ